MRPGKSKIYLVIAEKFGFKQEQLDAFRFYAEAFFHGIDAVEILKAGEPIPGKKGRSIPVDFLNAEVENRDGFLGDTQYRTCG